MTLTNDPAEVFPRSTTGETEKTEVNMKKDKTSKAFKVEGIGLVIFMTGLFLGFLSLVGYCLTGNHLIEKIAFGLMGIGMAGILTTMIAHEFMLYTTGESK